MDTRTVLCMVLKANQDGGNGIQEKAMNDDDHCIFESCLFCNGEVSRIYVRRNKILKVMILTPLVKGG